MFVGDENRAMVRRPVVLRERTDQEAVDRQRWRLEEGRVARRHELRPAAEAGELAMEWGRGERKKTLEVRE
jgi:hypothetical protein